MHPRIVIWSVALAAAASACHARAIQLAPPYMPRSAPGTSAGPTADERNTPLTELARAQRIPSLRTVQLPPGTRELRIADWYSMIAGQPVPALRVVEGPDGARGEVAYLWVERDDRPRQYRATTCSPPGDSKRVCAYVVPPASAPDWRSVAARLDSLGAWTISEPCERGSAVTDSGELLLQRLDGARFERYECNAPRMRRDTEAGRRAAALYDYFIALVSQAEGPPR